MWNGLTPPARESKFAANAPHRFHVVASRVVSPDRLETAAQGDIECSFEAAQRHARIVAESIARRFNTPSCCDLTDQFGHPVFSCTAGAR